MDNGGKGLVATRQTQFPEANSRDRPSALPPGQRGPLIRVPQSIEAVASGKGKGPPGVEL